MASRFARCLQIAPVLLAALLMAGVNCASAPPDSSPAHGRVEPSFLSGLERHLSAREYWASENGEGLQAPNRRHNLRTYFEPDGIRVVDREDPAAPELLGLRFAGWGRGDALTSAVPGTLSSAENRVENRRDGLVEWFVNGPEGLEHGFTVERRPEGAGELVFAMETQHAAARLAGEDVLLRTDAGRSLRYAKLVAWDAEGTPLQGRLEVPSPQIVQLVVRDDGAVYPLTIDPLLTEAADTQLESNQTGGELGFSVASAGDVNGDGFGDVIVGATEYDAGQADEGAAFVFLGSAAGVVDGNPATAHAQLESDQTGSGFGVSVSSAGDVNGDGYADVIVGANDYDAGESNEGAAFVFLGSASGIADATPVTAHAQLESDQASADLGQSVSSAGDVNGDGFADVIVGAAFYDDGETTEGSAFLFLGSASGIADANPATAHAQLESNQGGAQLGRSVSSAGDVNGDGYDDVIVGASSYDAGELLEGAAFVFLGSASGIADGNPGTAHAQLESNLAVALLGWSVSSAGDVNGDGYADVIVGAPNYDAGQAAEGAAFVFLGGASGIADGNPLTADAQLESDQASAQLGIAVASAGDVNGDGHADVIAGAPFYDAGQTDEGAAFVFLGSELGIADGNPATAYAKLESDQADAEFGVSVSSAGDVNGDGYADVIVGAYLYDAGQTDEGAAFVYLGGARGIEGGNPSTANAQLESDQAGANIGFSVASAGDVNGDGYADVIAGAPFYTEGEIEEGEAFLFLGGPSGVGDGDPGVSHARIEANQAGAGLGASVASAGDVNGDGYADVIVGAPLFDAGQTEEGAAFIFLGSASGVADGSPATAHAQLESNQARPIELPFGPRFGGSVASAGDVNGDGYADVIVGALAYDAGQPVEGAAFVFLGSASGIQDGNPATAHAQLEGNQSLALFGVSVSSSGDVNGDGYADVIVGARDYDAGQNGEGAAFVFLGSPSGIADGSPGTAHAQLETNQSGTGVYSVATAGDVNGDGYADVIVGAPLYNAGESSEGAAFVFLGSGLGIADGNPATAHAEIESNQSNSSLGSSVAPAGDVNGDGYADVIVGAPFYDAGESVEGAAFLFLGSAAGIAGGDPSTADAQLESNQAGARLGGSVSSAGDVNGDGFADVIVGAAVYDAGESDEGAAFVFLGNGEGRPVLVQARRADGTGLPVQPYGTSGAAETLRVEIRATHPEGRGKVKGEYEACPPGAPFGDAACATAIDASWTDVTATAGGVTLTHDFTSLAPDTLFRWRARVLHAPFGVDAPGVTEPPNPSHGPWRRYQGQAFEADTRVLPEPGALGSGAAALALLGWLRRRRSARN